jgi:hypothetical protein
MTPEQTAAYLNAQTALMNAEMQEMIADNQERISHGYALAYGPDQWKEFRENWAGTLGHNAVTCLFAECFK